MRSLSFTLFGLAAICHAICHSLAPPPVVPVVTTICTQLSAAIHDADHDEDCFDCYKLDDGGRPIGLAKNLQLQTPHAGRKFRPSQAQRSGRANRRRRWMSRGNRRFTEGWYYRLTLPEYGESFVFIFSIEDAGRYVEGRPSPLSLACMQLLGPGDTYLVQSDEDDTKFWGWDDALAFGCTFEWSDEDAGDAESTRGIEANVAAAMNPKEWREKVKTGFQVLPFGFQGRLDGHDGTLGGVKAGQGVSGTAYFDFAVKPLAGWGNYPPLTRYQNASDHASVLEHGGIHRQRSTAGWLASYPVFEPHWQVNMANARATGSLNWNGTVYRFEDAPFYGEKNWGGAFPTKWYWSQCNSFDDHPDLSFTAGGGIRQLPFSFLPGKRTEVLGLVGIHYNGRFYELVPWTGDSEWAVCPWGRWEFRGKCTDRRADNQFEVEIVAVTEEGVDGVPLRAPTKDRGMQYYCQDSGFGHVTLSLWGLEWDDTAQKYCRSHGKPIIDKATSQQCAVEVGGEYDGVWRVKSKMSATMKRLIRLPMVIGKIFNNDRAGN